MRMTSEFRKLFMEFETPFFINYWMTKSCW
jgi:hypothetical protein